MIRIVIISYVLWKQETLHKYIIHVVFSSYLNETPYILHLVHFIVDVSFNIHIKDHFI